MPSTIPLLRANRGPALLAAAVFALDRAVKAWAYASLRLGGSIPLWPGVFHLTYAQNTGMSFSLLSGWRWPLLLAPAAVSLVLLVFLWRPKQVLPPFLRWMGWLFLAGTLGNLYDRAVHGFVVDLFDPRFVRFAIFNIADVALCAAAGLTALWALKPPHA